jgi:hypothetical protein
MQEMLCAFCFALLRAGRSIAARMAMMAITTSNSINVKAQRWFADLFWLYPIFMGFVLIERLWFRYWRKEADAGDSRHPP